jgi:hypothetical protein
VSEEKHTSGIVKLCCLPGKAGGSPYGLGIRSNNEGRKPQCSDY